MKQERTQAEASVKPSGIEMAAQTAMPVIASARTGLASKDDALVRKLPVDYAGKTVRDLLGYITSTDITADESSLAESVKREANGRESVVMINGKKANLDDAFSKYATLKTHPLPNGAKKQYQELEIEISAVQQGGYGYFR
jgi:hypothetical protein